MRQKFGQHFLHSDSILEKIAALAPVTPDGTIVEIGPGRGALTAKLLDRAPKLVAIEIDSQLIEPLQKRFADRSNFSLIHGDAMHIDLRRFAPSAVVGNLPYYVATPIMERTIRMGAPGVFLIQLEVAQRMTAGPGSREYGYLSAITQLFCEPKIRFKVPAGAFQPPPKVESAVVTLTPVDRAAQLEIGDVEPFLAFLGAAFRQKRKTLRNNLRAAYPIDETTQGDRRAEQLTLTDLAALYRELRGITSGPDARPEVP